MFQKHLIAKLLLWGGMKKKIIPQVYQFEEERTKKNQTFAD